MFNIKNCPVSMVFDFTTLQYVQHVSFSETCMRNTVFLQVAQEMVHIGNGNAAL